MKMNPFTLLANSAKLIRTDRLLLAPSLIFSLGGVFVAGYFLKLMPPSGQWTSADIFRVGLSFWAVILIETLARTVTVAMANALLKTNEISPGPLLRVVARRIWHVWFAVTVLLLPVAAVALPMGERLLQNPTTRDALVVLAIVPVALALSTLIALVPAFVIIGERNAVSAVWESVKFMVRNIPDVVALAAIMFLMMILSLQLSAVMSLVPIVGRPVLSVLVQGCVSALMYVMAAVFYIGLTKPAQKVDENV